MGPKRAYKRSISSKRRDKIYLDYLQNRRGSTLAAPYCVRPKPGATVSAPLNWSEVESGLTIEEFTIHAMLDRINESGDLWSGAYEKVVDLKPLIDKIKQIQD
jgi:bifunctional non-homologous end joining protein LigD